MPTQRKQYCFWLKNIIISTTLVVFKPQLLLQILNREDLFLRMADSPKLENKRLYKPMLYQFCIANNAVETHLWPLTCLKQCTSSRNPIKAHQLLYSTLSHIKLSFQQIFYNLWFAQLKINFYLSMLNFCWAVYVLIGLKKKSSWWKKWSKWKKNFGVIKTLCKSLPPHFHMCEKPCAHVLGFFKNKYQSLIKK